MRPAGNPNSSHSVFNLPNKRQRTHETTPLINAGPSGPHKHSSIDRQIDLTNNDVESISRSPTDSEDSLNLGSEKRPSSRIANDGRATQRLKGSHRSGKSSKAVDTGSEVEGIDDFPVTKWGQMMPKEQKVNVRSMVRNLESRGGGESHPRKLNLKSGAPLPSTKRNPRVRLFFIEKGGQLADPNPQTGPNNNLLSLSTKFTHGTKGKGKGGHALALTDWVRGTEHLMDLRGYSLGFEVEGGRPFLYVKSADGPQELRIGGDEIQDLEVGIRVLGTLQSAYTPPTVTRPRMLERRRSS